VQRWIGDTDLNSLIVPREEHQMRSFSRSTSLRVEEIEQLFKNAVQCAKNAYATTGDSRFLFGCDAVSIRKLTAISIS
jgi:hypothetical protein